MEEIIQGEFQSHSGKGQGDEEKGLVENVGTMITEPSVEPMREAAIVSLVLLWIANNQRMFIHPVSMRVRFQEAIVPPECPLSNPNPRTRPGLSCGKRTQRNLLSEI